MYSGKTLFAQVMSFLPWTTFARIVDCYDGDRKVRTWRCTEHYRALAFAQLTGRESLHDIEACLAARSAKLYHSGSAHRCGARPWLTPTSGAIGGSTPISPSV